MCLISAENIQKVMMLLWIFFVQNECATNYAQTQNFIV